MKNPIITIINSILMIILLVVEIILLLQINISNGIKKQTVLDIIDNINIKEEIKNQEEYKELKNINPIIAEEIVTSDEFNTYFKENIKSIYVNIIYNENREYKESENVKNFISNKLEEYQSENINEETRIKIENITNSIIEEIDNSIEEIKQEKIGTSILRIIMSKTATYIILTGIILIISLLIIINKIKESLIWIGLPTIITGILFYILSLELKINITEKFKPLINDMTKTIKTTSMITLVIGFLTIILYSIQKLMKESEQNGTI